MSLDTLVSDWSREYSRLYHEQKESNNQLCAECSRKQKKRVDKVPALRHPVEFYINDWKKKGRKKVKRLVSKHRGAVTLNANKKVCRDRCRKDCATQCCRRRWRSADGLCGDCLARNHVDTLQDPNDCRDWTYRGNNDMFYNIPVRLSDNPCYVSNVLGYPRPHSAFPTLVDPERQTEELLKEYTEKLKAIQYASSIPEGSFQSSRPNSVQLPCSPYCYQPACYVRDDSLGRGSEVNEQDLWHEPPRPAKRPRAKTQDGRNSREVHHQLEGGGEVAKKPQIRKNRDNQASKAYEQLRDHQEPLQQVCLQRECSKAKCKVAKRGGRSRVRAKRVKKAKKRSIQSIQGRNRVCKCDRGKKKTMSVSKFYQRLRSVEPLLIPLARQKLRRLFHQLQKEGCLERNCPGE